MLSNSAKAMTRTLITSAVAGCLLVGGIDGPSLASSTATSSLDWSARTSSPVWSARTSSPVWSARTSSSPVWSARTSSPVWSAATSPRTPEPARAPNFLGIASMFNCSASLVRWPQSRSRDLALILTNGHCYAPSDKARLEWSGVAAARVSRQVIVDRRDNRPITLLKRNGDDRVTLRTSRVLYSTSFKTDVGLYRLRLTYAQIKDRYHVPALTLATHPPRGTVKALVPSGFSKRVYVCTLNGFAYRLFNDSFDWRHSLRFVRDPACRTIHGTSGSPVLNPRTRVVLGVNNAINLQPPGCASGRACTAYQQASLDCSVSLCEKTKSGRLSQHPHRRYAQQSWWLTTCVRGDRSLDLDLPGCLLPKPRAASR